jgi:hypothetical protein
MNRNIILKATFVRRLLLLAEKFSKANGNKIDNQATARVY